MIIESILEELLKCGSAGMPKSNLFRTLNLKTSVGEKYIQSLVDAGYISYSIEPWGKERERHILRLEEKGKKRLEWFLKLNKELDL